MKIKHKLLSDYQYVSPDKKIFLIKAGTFVDEYCYRLKGELIPLDKDIIENNPQIFELIDWKAELMSFMKANKMPQPAQLGKKLIPFIEEMILASMQQNLQTPTNDSASLREVEKRETELNTFKRDLDRRESDLDSRERRISDREDEIEIRMNRVQKREEDYKSDIKTLEKKEDEIRNKNKSLTEKELDIQDKNQELNERERNLDKTALMSAKEYDAKYAELQSKIDNDLKSLSKREKELEIESKRLKDLQENIDNNIELTNSKFLTDLKAEFRGIETEIRSLDTMVDNLKEFNHPVVQQVAGELIRAIGKLKTRVNNNLLD